MHRHSAYVRQAGPRPIVRHGWIVTDEDSGAVFDPTRWQFEHAAPYLFVGEPPDLLLAPCAACDCLVDEHARTGFFRPCLVCGCLDYEAPARWPYDEGGDRLREALHPRDLPAGQGTVRLPLDSAALLRLGLPELLTGGQVLWLANCPLSRLGDDAAAVYRALVQAGHKALIPVDNLARVQAWTQTKTTSR